MKKVCGSGLALMVAISLVAIPAGAAEPTRVLDQSAAPVSRGLVAPEDVFLFQAPNASNGIFSDPNCDFCEGPQILAAPFNVISGGMGIDIDAITVWGGYFPNDVPAGTTFEFVFYADNAGLPGTIECTDILPPTAVVATGVSLFGVSEYQVSITLGADCILDDGTHWVQVSTDTGPGTDDWFWEVGDVDVVYGILGNAFAFEYPPITWNFDGAEALAVQLEGTVVPVELQSISVD